MKRILVISVVIASMVGATGCDSYLDKVNPNALSAESIGASSTDLKLLLMGCYSGLQTNYKDGYLWLNCLTDVGWGSAPVTEGGATPETPLFLTHWSREYLLIGRCNELITIIEDLGQETGEIDLIGSEARFLRAFAYYHLLALYKDAPLITGRQAFDERFVSKNTQQEIKDFVISELAILIDRLPTNNDYPRVTKGAAMTLKAKVHAYFKEWDQVLSITAGIIDLNKYSLYPDYERLFTPAAEGSSESIFAVAYETGIGQGETFAGSWPLQPWATNLRPLSNFADAFYCTDGLPISESPLYNSTRFYENRDPRYDVSILRANEPWVDDRPYNPGTSVTGYSTQKYVRRTTLNREDGDQDFMIYRFADVLLLRAEALVEKGELGLEVYELVNQVRNRVNMPSIADVEGDGLSQETLRDIVRHERFVELSIEGEIRWFDIKRWGIVEDVYKAITFHKRVYRGDRTLYWPIPLREIDANPELSQHGWWD